MSSRIERNCLLEQRTLVNEWYMIDQRDFAHALLIIPSHNKKKSCQQTRTLLGLQFKMTHLFISVNKCLLLRFNFTGMQQYTWWHIVIKLCNLLLSIYSELLLWDFNSKINNLPRTIYIYHFLKHFQINWKTLMEMIDYL